MDEYLETLRSWPAHHKRYFSLGVSGGITAIIFLFWSFANFGGPETVVAQKVPDAEIQTTSPFQTIGNGLAATISAFKTQINGSKETLQKVDLQGQYQNMRDDALSNQNGY